MFNKFCEYFDLQAFGLFIKPKVFVLNGRESTVNRVLDGTIYPS
jgi:hypothetical protein